jgi:hypothetical protein
MFGHILNGSAEGIIAMPAAVSKRATGYKMITSAAQCLARGASG